jgi:hypothetical protein
MPAAHYVHPEYGLLCPTPRLRRRVRIAVALTVFALIGVAVLRASNYPPSAPTVAGREEGAGPDSGQPPAATLAAWPSLTEDAEAAGKTACERDSAAHRTWTYLDGKCVAGKARKARTGRIDPAAIAAIPLGRTAALPESALEPAPSAATSVPAGPETDPSKSAQGAPVDIASVTSQRPAAASKKPQKTARSQNRRRDPTWSDAPWWREVRADDWGTRGYGERDYGRSGYAREDSFGFFR